MSKYESFNILYSEEFEFELIEWIKAETAGKEKKAETSATSPDQPKTEPVAAKEEQAAEKSPAYKNKVHVALDSGTNSAPINCGKFSGTSTGNLGLVGGSSATLTCTIDTSQVAENTFPIIIR